MEKKGYKDYFIYLSVVKIAEIVIFVNFFLILFLVLLVKFQPGSFGQIFYSLIGGIRETFFPYATSIEILDRIIMIFLMSLPAIAALITSIVFYIRAYNLKCDQCDKYVVRNKKVLLSFSPPKSCPNCSAELKVE